MPTTKKRINVTVPNEPLELLEALAKRDQVPVATKAKELLEEILEIYEDEILAEIAEERLKKGSKTYSHEEAWS